jgi:hypothetical protein
VAAVVYWLGGVEGEEEEVRGDADGGDEDEAEQQKDQTRGGSRGGDAGSKKFVVLYTSAQSEVAKVSESPDLILLTENWYSSEILDAYLAILGYEVQLDIHRADMGETDREAH